MNLYLINASGFFLQFFPCTMLCYLAFPHSSFRIDHKKVLGTQLFLSLLFSCSFPFALRHLLDLFPLSLLANFWMLFAIVTFFLFFAIVTKDHIIKKLMVLYVVIFFASTQYWIVNFFLPFTEPDFSPDSAYSISSVIQYAITDLLLFPLAAILFVRILRHFLQEFTLKGMRWRFALTLFSTTLYFCSIIYTSSIFTESDIMKLYVLLPLSFALLILQMLCYYLLFYESVRARREFQYQRLLEKQQDSYDKITLDIENARRLHHDMRHHYQALYDMAKNGEDEKICAYLSPLIEQTNRHETHIYCKNAVINALLLYYADQAASENILCTIRADCGELNISAPDLTVLIGNSLENALHSCRTAGPPANLQVNIRQLDNHLLIQIENTCRKIRFAPRAVHQESFLTAENFRTLRENDEGYGLRNISLTAEKYNGYAKFRYDSLRQTFTTRIQLTASRA